MHLTIFYPNRFLHSGRATKQYRGNLSAQNNQARSDKKQNNPDIDFFHA